MTEVAPASRNQVHGYAYFQAQLLAQHQPHMHASIAMHTSTIDRQLSGQQNDIQVAELSDRFLGEERNLKTLG
jgi:hypothetical protein